MEDHSNLFPAAHAILPGVHEIIPHCESIPLAPSSWNTSHSKVVTHISQQAYSQHLYDDLQYRNRMMAPRQLFSQPNRLTYESRHLFYPPDRRFVHSFGDGLQEKYHVNPAWLSSQFYQSHSNAMSSLQWMSNASISSKFPATGYGSGHSQGVPFGLQFIRTHQSHVLEPIQQPEVHPTPPSFWMNRSKSKTLSPLPRPICSSLEVDMKPQIHHVGCSSPFEQCVCSDFSFDNPANTPNNNTTGIWPQRNEQSLCSDDLSYNVPTVNRRSLSSEYQTAAIGFNREPSATVSVRGSEAVNRNISLFNENDVKICQNQEILLDENCNHIYNYPVTNRTIKDEFGKDDETSPEEDDLSTSMIEEYIQSAPDFHSLSQMQPEQSMLMTSMTGQTASNNDQQFDMVMKDKIRSVSPDRDVNNLCDAGKGSTLDNLRKIEQKAKISCTRDKKKVCREEIVFSLRTSYSTSSSSEVSPITAACKSTTQSLTRRRSYRSRNFSKEFCNRWSNFEDVPLVISRKPKCQIMCSTPKKANVVENTLIEKGYKCEICSKCFANNYSYSRHVKKHKIDAENCQQKQTRSKAIYHCSDCNTDWFNRNSYINHSQNHLNKVQKSSVTRQTQNIEHKVDTHELDALSTVQGKSFDEISSRRYVCNICGDSFSSCYEYNAHFAAHVKVENEFLSSNESDSSLASPRYFRCSVCNLTFVNRFMYSKHCVSQEHRMMQKHKETRKHPGYVNSEMKVHGKTVVVKRDHSNIYKIVSSPTDEQSNSASNYLSEENSPNDGSDLVLKHEAASRNEVKSVQYGCPPASTLVSNMKLQCAKYDQDTADDSHSHGVPQTNSVATCQYCLNVQKANLEGSLNSRILCKCLFAKVKSFEGKTKVKSSVVEKHVSKDTQQECLIKTQVVPGYADADCSVISEKLSKIKLCSCHSLSIDGSVFDDKLLKLDANNNPMDVTTHLDYTDITCHPSCNVTLSLDDSYVEVKKPTDNLLLGTEDKFLSKADGQITGSINSVIKPLALKKSPVQYKIPVQVDRNNTPESNSKLETIDSVVLLTEDVSKLQTVDGMGLSVGSCGLQTVDGMELSVGSCGLQTVDGMGLSVGSCGLQTDVGSLESSDYSFNLINLQSNGFTNDCRLDPDKSVSSRCKKSTKVNETELVNTNLTIHHSSKNEAVTKCIDSESESEIRSINYAIVQEDRALKGDSGLWSDDDVCVSEWDVDECSDVLELNDSKSDEIWSIEIVNYSDKLCDSDAVCDAELVDSLLSPSEQTGKADEKTIVSFEVKYDAMSNSVNLYECTDEVDGNKWKFVSDCVDLSSGSLSQLDSRSHSPVKPTNLHDVVVEKKCAVEGLLYNNNNNTDSQRDPQQPPPRSLHCSRRKKMSAAALLLNSEDDPNGKIYFCEICGETFLNPFRYSAHYKKKAHVKLASDFFSYGNLSQTLPKKRKDKGQKHKIMKMHKRSKQEKNGKPGDHEKNDVKKQRKRHPETKIRFDSASADTHRPKHSWNHENNQIAFKTQHSLKNKAADVKRRAVKRNLPLIPNGLKKLSSDIRLKRSLSRSAVTRSSKLLHKLSSRRYNAVKNHVSSETHRIACFCCSQLFVTNEELQIHTCPINDKRFITVDETHDGHKKHTGYVKHARETGKGQKNLKAKDLFKKETFSLNSVLHDEQPLKKRKPVVKCPALVNLLSTTDEELKKDYGILNQSSSPSSINIHVPGKAKSSSPRIRKRHLLCTQHKKCSQSRKSSHVKVFNSELLNPVKQFYKHGQDIQHSTSISNRAEMIQHGKKRKLSCTLPHSVGKTHKRRKFSNFKYKNDSRSVQNETLNCDLYCDVCKKSYSTRSHLKRHFETFIHKMQLIEKTSQKNT